MFWKVAISFVTAFVSTWFIYDWVLNFAIKYGIVDNPDARKLQRVPVPVLGGITVFVGILIVTILGVFFLDTKMITITVIAMTVMLIIGTIDDAKGLSPAVRFIFEIGVVLYVIYLGDIKLGDFYRLWGVRSVPDYFCVPLTVFASVGIMNAINLIDGVDGYSSGFGAMACSVFAIMFYALGNQTMMIIAVAAAGALIPFFLHNVFGRKSKMFIGDGGTLMLGTAMTIFVFNVLSTEGHCAHFEKDGMGLIPFALAVMSVPVFDTLRVMSTRMYRGLSPFHADRTHLHHLYIEMGFSHVGAAISIVTTNLLTVMLWLLSWKLGASIDTQFYIVVFLSFMSTFGFYWFIKWNKKHDTRFYAFCCRMGEHTHLERKGSWLFIQRMVDMNVFGIGKKTE